MFTNWFQKIYCKENLTAEESRSLMEAIMDGNLSPVQMAGILTALNMKGESITEITSFARVMREKSVGEAMEQSLLDTCGTGGDKKNLFNVSTAVAFVVAASGVAIAKHGNRAVSSASGSADILQAMGCNIELDRSQVIRSIEELGIGFLFAQTFHPAMRHVGPVRRELGVRTVFNILGPLANPLHARNQFMGVFSSELTERLVHVLYELGEENGVVFCSDDGMDEISLFAPTRGYFFQKRGDIQDFYINPRDLGLNRDSSDLSQIMVANAQEAKRLFSGALQGTEQIASEIIALNAASALWLMQKTQSIREGLELAFEMIHTGKAIELLEKYVHFTQRFAPQSQNK